MSSPLRGLRAQQEPVASLMMEILNKCILSILVYNLFLDRQRNMLCTPHYCHTAVYRLSTWTRNLKLKTNWLGEKKRIRHQRKIYAVVSGMYFCCYISIRIAINHSRISLCISQTGTTQTAGARNKGGNFIGQLCISVVPHSHLEWSVQM